MSSEQWKTGMKRPHGIHGRKRFWRSRLFWLGVPGLVFLLWVSIAVPQTFNSLSWETARYQIVAAIQSHNLVVVKRPFPHKIPAANRGIKLRPGLLSSFPVGEPSGLPLRVRTREINPGTGVSEVTVSTWVFAPAYVVVWLGTLVFWQRWKRKKLQEVEP